MGAARHNRTCLRPSRRRVAARGFFALEIAAVTGLTLALLLMFAMAARQYAAAQRDGDVREEVLRAAENELAQLQAGLSPLPVPGVPRERNSGLMRIEITAEPGTDAWNGMLLVRVVARRQVRGYWVLAEAAAYMPGEDRHEL